MKNILVLMHDDAGQEARFQAALDLARALNGHLSCLGVALAPVVTDYYGAVGATAILMADEQEREAANRDRMEARLKTEDVPYDWMESTGFASINLAAVAGLADVIVLNREAKDLNPDMDRVVGEVLIKTGRPVVAVPAQHSGFDVGGDAVVAWDGSSSAQAALRAATPLLQLASGVTIVECVDGSTKTSAEEAATYLSRHGIRSSVRRLSSRWAAPSSVLLAEIERIGPAYMVMGGFGHSRILEALLGGVTRRMLQESPVPLFLAH